MPICSGVVNVCMSEGNTFVNALIGAVVTVVTVSVLPFSPLVGGAVSGYLEGGDAQDALKVGAISGFLALIPVVLLLMFIGNVLLIFFIGGGASASALLGGLGFVFFLLVFVTGLLYVVLLSAVGGWVGLYLKQELDL